MEKVVSVQVVKSSLTPFSVSRRSNPRNLINYRSCRSSRVFFSRGFKVHSKLQEKDDNQSNGEEPPESLFMKELKRRGMNPTSVLEESNRSLSNDDEMKFKEEGRYTKRNAVSTEYEKSLTNQRETSMALNSEGLEGLVPRAKVLLSLGATFFLGFWPLILITVATFSALYLYFGPTFIHDANNMQISPPQYVDPYELLEDERISEMARRVN